MMEHANDTRNAADAVDAAGQQSTREYGPRENWGPATVQVLVQPEEKMMELPRPKTARQLLAALGLREETALVAREGELLTPDRRIFTGDNLLVRKVTSSG